MEFQNIEKVESQSQSQPQQTQDKGTTFIRTCFNGLNALSGIGILSVPYALSEGGWLCLAALFVIAILCFYTGLLMKRCMDVNPLVKTYPDIGAQAFGRKGRFLVSTIMYLELFLLAVEFLILEGDNLHKLFPRFGLHVFGKTVGGKQSFILISAIVMLPTTWLRSLSLLAYVSAGGILATVVLVGSISWSGTFGGVGFHEKGVIWRWDGVPTAISLFTFCYCGHAVFPTLCNSMKDKSKFPKVLLVCFTLSTIGYGSMAILGYMMYGDNLLSQVTLNLPTKNISSKISIYTTLVNPVAKYALIISPIATAVEDAMMLHDNTSISPIMISLVIRTILVVSTVIVALLLPFFGYIMAFMGAFLGISASLLFPCVCYLKINKASRRFGAELILILVIVVLGFFVAVTGTFISARDIIKHVYTK